MINKALYQMCAALYRSLGLFYTFMISIADGSVFRTDMLQQASQNIYILVGIFMLFRVAVSLLNMVIDPDRVSDKQSGAGKMISRILVSIVLLLTMNSLIFPLAKRLQDAIISPKDGSGSILFRIFEISTSGDYEYDDSKHHPDDTTTPRPTKDSLVCYYFKTNFTTGSSNNFTMNTGSFYKIMFTTTSSGTKVNNKENYFKFATGKEHLRNYEEDTVAFNFSSYNSITNQRNNTNAYSSCPRYLKSSGSSLYDNDYADETNSSSNEYLIFGGNSLADTLSTMTSIAHNKTGDTWKSLFNIPGGSNTTINTTIGNENSEIKTIIENGESNSLSRNGIHFARSIFNPFIHCVSNSEKAECEKAKSELFTSSDVDKKMEKWIKNEDASLDNFLALIVGIAIFLFMVWLCLEIAVRAIKMLLLEFISPIAIIAYMNPNDEIFKKWTKMYIGAYLELFFKLFAISLVTLLLGAMNIFDGSGKGPFETLVWILALFIFAMSVPNLLSEIFGIKDMAGGFKDTFNLAKKGLGFGAGAVVGGIGGLLGGALGEGGSVGNAAKGFLGGMARGAKGGWKGNIKGGLSDQAQRNKHNRWLSADRAQHNDSIVEGDGKEKRTAVGDWWGTTVAKGQIAIGQKTHYEVAEEKLKAIKDAQSDVDRYESLADKKAMKYSLTRYRALADAQNALNDAENGRPGALDVATATANFEKAKKQARKQYTNDLMNGMYKDDIDEHAALDAANASTRAVSPNKTTYYQNVSDNGEIKLTEAVMKKQSAALDNLEKFVETKKLTVDVVTELHLDSQFKSEAMRSVNLLDKELKSYIEANANTLKLIPKDITLQLEQARQSGKADEIKVAEEKYSFAVEAAMDEARIALNAGDPENKYGEKLVKASSTIKDSIQGKLIEAANDSDFSKIITDSVGKVKDTLGENLSTQKMAMADAEASYKAASQGPSAK